MRTTFIVLLVALPILLDVWATMTIFRDEFAERAQKVSQLLLVWLVPIAGAILVLAVHGRPENASGKYREPRDPPDELPGAEH